MTDIDQQTVDNLDMKIERLEAINADLLVALDLLCHDVEIAGYENVASPEAWGAAMAAIAKAKP